MRKVKLNSPEDLEKLPEGGWVRVEKSSLKFRPVFVDDAPKNAKAPTKKP